MAYRRAVASVSLARGKSAGRWSRTFQAQGIGDSIQERMPKSGWPTRAYRKKLGAVSITTDEPDGQSGQRAAILGKICLICVRTVDKVEYFPGDRRYLQGFLFLSEGQAALASVVAGMR